MMKPLLSLCVLASLCLPQPTAADQTDYAEYTPAPGSPASVHAADMRAWLQQLSPSQRAKAQAVIDEYRRDHPEEYRDDEAERLRGMIDTYVSELVDARQQLARYKEREAVQGWAPL